MDKPRPRVPGPIQAALFRMGARLLGPMARVERLDALARAVARSMARLTLWANRARPSGALPEVATEWDRMFRESFPASHLTAIGETEAEGEITAPCPLGFAGSGELRACDRAMEYDREMVRRLGGEFRVIESQATPGVHRCRLAIRLKAGGPARSGGRL
jgi:hypothetical protein